MLAKLSKLTATSAILAVLISGCSTTPEVTEDAGEYGYSDESWSEPAEEEVTPPKETVEKAPVRIALRDDVPDRYVVKKGDTLWDISSLFLRDPWLWPEIWYFNPQIENPHLIYPGDVLTLVYVDGKPQLRLSREGETVIQRTPEVTVPAGLQAYKLSPNVREEGLDKAIPTIPVDAIEAFLNRPRIITKKELEAAPYIVSSLDQHLVSAAGNTVYARNLTETGDVRYFIFRPGRAFKDPRTGKILGYETTMVSEAKLVEAGEPATLTLTRSIRETLNGDRILPADKGKISYNFVPKPPSTTARGQIIALVDAISQTAKNQIVVMNLGEQHGMEVGTVLAIEQSGAEVQDPVARRGNRTIKLPNTRAGLTMIFRVFDQVSYGLVMDSQRAIHLDDLVVNPTPSADVLTQ